MARLPTFSIGFSSKARSSSADKPAPGQGRAVIYPQAANRDKQPYRDNWPVGRAVDWGLLRSVWVWRACVAIASNAAKLPIVLRQDDWVDGKIIKGDELTKRLNYNPTRKRAFNATVFRRMLSMQMLLNRQGAFVEVVRTRDGEVYSVNLLPSGYTWPIPDAKDYISGYSVYFPGTEEVKLPEDRVVWFREPHPLDPYAGMTPLEPLGLSVESDWYQRVYNRNFILNDARPGGFLVLSGASQMDGQDFNTIRAKFGNGPMQSGRLEILDADTAQWIDGSTTPRDAQYSEMRKAVKDEILQGFGVPESIAGNASQRTFANADAEMEVFWRETELPHLELQARAWDQLTPEDDIFVSFDWGRVPILERDIRAQREFKLRELQAGAIANKEYRAETGRAEGFGKNDRIYVGVSLQEVGSADDPEWVDPMEAQQGMGMGEQGALPFGEEAAALPEGEQPAGEAPAGDGNLAAEAPPAEGLPPMEEGQSLGSWADSFFGSLPPAPDTALSFKALRAPTGHDDGIMVALRPPQAIRDSLAIEGAEPAEELHVTLCYLGKVDDDGAPNPEDLASIVHTWSKISPPMTARAQGAARFDKTHRDGESALVALVDCPGLSAGRAQLVELLEAAGVTYSGSHDFTAHITRAYADAGTPIPPIPVGADAEWPVTDVWLVVGGTWIGMPLTGAQNAYSPAQSPTKAQPVTVNDEHTEFLDKHAAWESTVANAIEHHFDAQEGIVLAKLDTKKNRDILERKARGDG